MLAHSLTIRDITKRYGQQAVLEGITLDVKPGEFITLLGPSGSGKTTLLMVLAGFATPDGGVIELGGTDITRLPPHKRDIGLVFQSYALFPHMNVFQNVAYPLKLRRVSSVDVQRRVNEALDLVQLGGFGERSVSQLSGGQRQRVALARAVVFEPRMLLMDEPLSALDKQLRERMQLEIRTLHDRLGATTVYVTHDQREALTMSDRVAVLSGGQLAQVGVPREIYERPVTKFVASFVGDSDFLNVEARKGLWFAGAVPLRTDVKAIEGERRLLLVRPEKLTLNPLEAEHYTQFHGLMRRQIHQGDSYLCLVGLDHGKEIAVRVGSRFMEAQRLPEIGEKVIVALHERDVVMVDDT